MNAERRSVNVAASVRARLLNLARQRGEEFQLVLSDFATERLLYRLSVSPHADRFVLKGAMLFRLWSTDRYRATWDLDLLGHGAASVDAVVAVVRDLCAIATDDGLSFEPASIVGAAIRAEEEYAGVRVKLVGDLAGARIPMQIDVGFGDVVIPGPRRETYPTLLDHPAPRILAYPREAVVAEKLEAITTRGATNSRMKDFYDLHLLATRFHFDGGTLARAITTTFKRRNTPIPRPDRRELSHAFLTAPERRALWNAFWKRARTGGTPESVENVADMLQHFLGPVLVATMQERSFDATWEPSGPWSRPDGSVP